MTTINSSYSAPNVWATNLTGNYANSEVSWIQSPEFNFTGLTAPIVEFKMWYIIQTTYTDGACLQYTTDNGTTWNHVGAAYGSIIPDPNATNWYVENSIVGLNYTNGWTGNTGGWVTGKYILNSATQTNLAGQPSVRFRFLFGSNTTTQNQGIAIDNFSVYQQPNTDIGVVSLYSIEDVCIGSNDVYAIVQNFGLNTITSFNVAWEVNSAAQTGYTYSGSIPSGETDTVFLGAYNFAVGTTYNVVAATANPNGILDQNDFNNNYTITGLTTSLSGTYTVGTGGDYPTIASAITALQTTGVCNPVTMSILPGTYTGNYSIGAIPGANAVNTIKFTSSTGSYNDVTLTFTGTAAADNWVWRFNGCSYVILEKLTLTNTHATYGRVVEFINGGSNNTVNSCKLNSSGTVSTTACVYSNTTQENNITLTNNIFNNGYYGVYARGVSSSVYETGMTVSGNTFNNPYYYGMNIGYQNGLLIENNTMNISSASTTNYAIYNYYTLDATIKGNVINNTSASATGYGINNYYADGAQKVLNNKISMTNNGTTYGIYLYYCDGSSGSEALIANNFVYQGVGTGTIYGISTYYSTYQNLYFNSVHVTGGSATAGRALYFTSSSTTGSNIRVVNNNVVNSGPGYVAEVAAASVTAGYITYSNRNNFYKGGNVLIRLGTTDYATLAAYQAATTMDANSYSTDPSFVSNSDLHTSNSTLNGTAEPFTSVSIDIDGEARNATTPDIGADEFTPAQNDAGVSEFIGVTNICPGQVTVVANIGNFGLVPLTSVQINWMINGVAQPAVNATGLNIPSGGNGNVNLGSYTFASGTNYQLKAWTDLPNGAADANHLNDTTLIANMQTSLSGTYTVGTSGDFTTLAAAANALTQFGVCGPVVINVASGTYTGAVTLGIISGTSATNTVIIQSASGIYSDVTVQYAGTGTADNWVLAFNGCDYVTVRNMTFIATTTADYGRVVVFDLGANYNVIDGCKITTVVGTSSSNAGIYSTTTSVDNFNTISNNIIENGYYGIYYYGSSTAMEDGLKILNNSITGFYYYGIYHGYALNTQTIGNTIVNGSNSATNYALRYYYNDGLSIITDNIITGTNSGTFYGIYYYYCDPDPASPALIANNFISYQGGATSTAYGLYIYNVSATRVYHNSVNILTGSATASAAAYYFYTTGTTYANTATYWIDSKNNNFSNTGGGYTYLINEGVFQLGSMLSDHNNLWASGSNLTKVGTVNQTNLAGWQNYYPGDVKNVNPAYASNSDLHTNSPDLNEAAVFVSQVTTDIDGDLRSTTTPDIGADEFTPSLYDAGIAALLNLNGVCPGTVSIEAIVQNFGLDTLTSAWVHWSVNGVSQPTLTWTGLLLPLGTDTITLGAYAFTTGTTYIIEAHTSHPNNGTDGNAGNDGVTTPSFGTAMAGTYTVGTTGNFTTISQAAQALATNGICSDVIISIEPGTYNESISLAAVPGAGASATITFQSSTGINTDVIVTKAGTSSANYVFNLDGVDYVTIQNMTLTNTAAATYGRVINVMNGAEHITINNNKITSIIGTSSSAAGIYVATGLNNYLTVSNNIIKNGYYGMYLYGTSTTVLAEGFQILNNSVTDFYYYGIYAYYLNNLLVEGNFVETTLSTTSATIYLLNCNYCDGQTKVLNNEVRDTRNITTVYGLRVYYCDAPSMNQATLVANNRVIITGTKTTVYAMYLGYNAYIKSYYNSVNVTTGTSTCRAAYLYGSTTAGTYNFIMRNNSIVSNVNAAAYSIYYYGHVAGLESDHNNYYNNGTNFGYHGANVITQADWQVFHPGDVVSAASAYIANNNLHSISALLESDGTPVAEVTTDMDGDVRNSTTPDIGADEFELPANDLELANVYTLGEIPQGAGDNHVLVARVTNVGTNTQYNSAITLNITGANTQTVIAVIDSIQGGVTKYINFPAYTLTNLGWNTLTVSVQNDMNNSNNTLVLPQLATANVMTYADTTASVGNGGNNDADGHIYWNKYYINGLKSITQVTAFITADANNTGNTVYGAVMDMNNNLLAITAPHVITAGELSSYITMTFPDPSLLTFANENAYIGFVQTPTVTSSYFPIGFQNEIPMRPQTFYYSANMNGTGFTTYTNNRRWMIKATLEDPTPFDAAMVSLAGPAGGCGLGLQQPSFTMLNNGSDTISSFTMSYQVIGSLLPVTETISGVSIVPGDQFTYTFTTPYDFTVVGVDSLFEIEAWVTLSNDTINTNDTLIGSVESLFVPVLPTVTGTTVPFGSQATLYASSPYNLIWYNDALGTTAIDYDSMYVTPQLFDTTSYWVAATSTSTGLFTLYGSGATYSTTPCNPYGQLYTSNESQFVLLASDLIAMGITPGFINSLAINVQTPTTQTTAGYNMNNYSIQMGHTNFSAVTNNASSWTTSGLQTVYTAPNFPTIAGWNTHVFQTPFFWNGDDNLIIQFCYSNYYGSSSYTTNATLIGQTMPYVCAVGAYTDGTFACGTVTTTYYSSSFMPQMQFNATIPGCASDLVEVVANVSNIPAIDAGVSAIISPTSGYTLGNETICVEIENLGSVSISNFPISVEVDNGFQLTEIAMITLAPGSTASYCFNYPVNLSAFTSYEMCVYTQLPNDGYAGNDSLCATIINDSTICASNATSALHEEIVEFAIANYINNTAPSYGATYSNFYGLGAVTNLVPGMTYPLQITTGFAPSSSTNYTCYAKVFADWNHDGAFTGTNELIYGALTNSNNTISGSFTVPANAYLGHVSLRVVVEETSVAANVTACGTYTYGETEDYKINIQPPVQWDAAIFSITEPSGILTEGQTSLVVATFANAGIQTITSLTFNYTINGGTPVTYTWTGSLAQFASATVTLPTMTIPGGYFDLCVAVTLPNDGSPANNSVCSNYFALPQYNLAMLEILAPESGCDLGNEVVTIKFKNLGDTISTGVPVSFKHNQMGTPVTETYIGTVLPNTEYTYSFTTPVNLTTPVNAAFTLSAWLSFAGDPVFTNDTMSVLIEASLSPALPAASNITIWSGNFATLNVLNPDTNQVYTWYDADTLQLVADIMYQTPVLYDTTVYYLTAASGSAGSIAITEIGIGDPDYIEIHNITNSQIDATGWVVAVSNNYSDINSVNANLWALTVMPGGQVLYKSDSSTDNYWGSNLMWNPGAPPTYRGWAIIIDNLGNVVDFANWGWTDAELAGFTATINGYNVDFTTLWSGGFITPTSNGFLVRTNYDTDTPSDWANLTVGSKGVANAGMVISGGSGAGCETSLVPVTVNVQYADYDAAIHDIITPVSGSFLTTATVSAIIYNNGINIISNIPCTYTVNGINPVSQVYTGSIAPGDSATITFTTPVGLSIFGQYDICVTADLINDGYAANNSYCKQVINYNGDGLSCANAFPYGTVNDPAQNSQTTFAYDSEWWSFTIPAGYSYNNVVISLCGSGFDTYLYYYTACNTAPASSNDNSCGTSSQISLGTATLTAGTYFVKVSGSSTNFGSYTLNITGSLIPKFIVTLNTYAADCNGTATGDISSNISSGPTGTTAVLPVSYHWSNNAVTADLSNIVAGTYVLSVTDATGWTEVVQTTVSQPAEIAIVVDSVYHNTVIGGNTGSIGITVTGGVTPYTYIWGNGATTQDLSALYAGIYNLTVTDNNGCTKSMAIPVNSPSPWTVTPTTISHMIVIPQNAIITLDQANLTPGSFVGVFYDSAGTLACGGWAYWSGMSTTLTAYGANVGQENGFNPNETFTWKVYSASLGVQYPGTATYNTLQYPNAGTFTPGGLSGISKVEAYSIITQTITIPNGWSLFSTYIQPLNPNIAAVLADLGSCANPNQIVIVKNGAGQIYWPQYCLNFIYNMVVGQGYQIKVQTPGPTTSFGVTGFKLDANTPFNIAAGWSFLGYLKDTPANIATMLAAIAPMGTSTGCTEIVKNSSGAIFWPLYSLNLIGNMIPGQGYQIKNKCAVITNFAYPLSGTKDDVTSIEKPRHFIEPQSTGNNMTLGIPASAWTIQPETGDEIGIFNSANELIGSGLVHDQFTAISVWGKELIENTDKGSEGTQFTLKLYQSLSGTEVGLQVEKWEQGCAVYQENAIAIASKIAPAFSAENWVVGQNSPNPFSNSTYIPVFAPVSGKVEIKLYNALGEMVQVIYQSELQAGHHDIKVDADHLPAGNYYYRFTADSFNCTKYMTIQ